MKTCDECVSRQALLEFFKDDDYVVNEIKNMPPVLPKREHGEWIEKVHNFEKCWAECSVCGKTASGHSKDTGWGYTYSYTDYCPNCGAEMR